MSHFPLATLIFQSNQYIFPRTSPVGLFLASICTMLRDKTLPKFMSKSLHERVPCYVPPLLHSSFYMSSNALVPLESPDTDLLFYFTLILFSLPASVSECNLNFFNGDLIIWAQMLTVFIFSSIIGHQDDPIALLLISSIPERWTLLDIPLTWVPQAHLLADLPSYLCMVSCQMHLCRSISISE